MTGLAEPSVLIAIRRIHGRDYAGELTALKREHPSVRRVVTLDEPLEGGVTADEFLAAGAAVPARDLERARRAVHRSSSTRPDIDATRRGAIRTVGIRSGRTDRGCPRW